MLSHFKFEFVWILISRRVELKIDFYDIIFLYLKTLIFKIKVQHFNMGRPKGKAGKGGKGKRSKKAAALPEPEVVEDVVESDQETIIQSPEKRVDPEEVLPMSVVLVLWMRMWMCKIHQANRRK